MHLALRAAFRVILVSLFLAVEHIGQAEPN